MRIKTTTIRLSAILLLWVLVVIVIPYARLASNAYPIYSTESFSELLNPQGFIYPWICKLLAENVTGLIGLQLMFGIIMFLGLFVLLRKLGLNREIYTNAIVLSLLTPSFIFLFSQPNSSAFALALLVWGLALVDSTRKLSKAAGFLLLCASASSSGFWALVVLVAALSYNRLIRDKLLAISLAIISTGLFLSQIPETRFSSNLLNKLVFEFGAANGISLSVLLLGMLGLVLTWKRMPELKTTYFFVLLTIIAISFNFTQPYLLSFLLIIFSGYSLVRLKEKKWELMFLKRATIILLMLSLIIPALMSMALFMDATPTHQETKAINFLAKLNTRGVVLTSGQLAPAVEFIAKLRALPEPALENRTMKDIEEMYHSMSLKETLSLMKAYNISHILISESMKKSNRIWHEENEGLLFLLRNNETFKLVYNESKVMVWEVRPELTY